MRFCSAKIYNWLAEVDTLAIPLDQHFQVTCTLAQSVLRIKRYLSTRFIGRARLCTAA